MKISKSVLIAGAAATIGLAGLGAVSMASAQSSSTAGTGIIDRLAAKFNLNKSDVQAVFDEQHAANQAARQQEQSADLQKLVDSGKITAAQKTLIEDKLKDMQTARDKERTDVQAWASQNNIDLKYVMMHGGRDGDESDDLQQLVTDGKITAAQKTLIENKRAELKKAHEDAHAALVQWAKDNNIDLKYLRGDGPGRMHRGMMGGDGDKF